MTSSAGACTIDGMRWHGWKLLLGVLSLSEACSGENAPREAPGNRNADAAADAESSVEVNPTEDAAPDDALVGDAGVSDNAAHDAPDAPHPETDACTARALELRPLSSGVLLALDRSLSMAQSNSWELARQAVAEFAQVNDQTEMGLWLFPAGSGPSPLECSVSPVAQVAMGPDRGADIAKLLASAVPWGQTPTGALLQQVAASLPTLHSATRPLQLVLITDGAPACALMPPDPAELQRARDAMDALNAAHVPVTLIGVNVGSDDQTVLDELAQRAGKTMFTRAGSAAQVLSALSAALQDALACPVAVAELPNPESLVRVSINGLTLLRDRQNGWELTGTTVSLHGTACARVREPAQVVDVQVKCP